MAYRSLALAKADDRQIGCNLKMRYNKIKPVLSRSSKPLLEGLSIVRSHFSWHIRFCTLNFPGLVCPGGHA
jgi:hypothetical protein